MTGEFGELLRRVRKQAGLTQEELARRSGVSERTVRRLETHKDPNPQLETVRLLADALGLDPDEHAQLLAMAGGAPVAQSPTPPKADRPRSAVEHTLAAASDDLAGAVAARCKRDEELRRIQDPVPLAVRWRAAPDELIDHWANIRRAKPGVDVDSLPVGGRLDEIVDVYQRIPSGRLVVLGRAGSGKTMLAVRFVLDLLATRASGDVVPVLVSLGSWDPAKAGLRDWLTRQLERDYPGLNATGEDGATLAAALVARDRVLPVLDGFDEIAEGLHRAALEELNVTPMPLVLTSRPHDYAMAVGRTDVLTAAAGVEVTDLTVTDLTDYLPRTTRKSGAGWDAVLTELRANPHGAASVNLQAVLTTPLMVALARASYSDAPGADPAELLDLTRFPTPEAVEDHLLSSFVSTAYQDGRPDGWEPERVRRWLHYLADHLHRLGDRRDLAWWELGTSTRLVRRMLVIGLVGGSAVGVVNLGLEIALSSVPRALFDAVMVAVTVGLVLGLLHGVAVKSAPIVFQPSRARIRLRGAKWAQRRLGTRMRYGAVAGLALGVGFGLLRELVVARLAGARLGLSVIVSDVVLHGLVFAVAISLAAGLVAVLEAPLDVKSVVSPADLLRTNRSTMAVQLVVFGMAFAVIIAGGSMASVWLIDVMGLDRPFGLTDLSAGLLFFAGLASGLAGGLGYAVTMTAWGQWIVLARLWLPLTGRLPWALNAFLDDACRRGLLRQSGAVYQFRHARLQDHLMAADLR